MSTAGQPELSLVIPLYNEAPIVQSVIERIVEALETSSCVYELILVNNGSTDDTAGALGHCARRFPRVRIVNVEKNEGYGQGILLGLRQARGEYVAYMSGDGQIQPHDVVRVYQAMVSEGHPVGKVSRVVRKDGWIRRINSFCYNGICRLLLGVDTRDMNATPKVISRELLQRLDLCSKDWFIDAEFMLKIHWLGCGIVDLPTEYLARPHGKSKVRVSAMWEFLGNIASVRWAGRFASWRDMQSRDVMWSPQAERSSVP
jgi:glycosyltransferase involved in cell wall biosynthesis